MGYKKERRPVLFRAGVNASTNNHTSTGAWFVDQIQSLTGASTGTTVTNFGLTHITSTGAGGAGAKVFTMANPVKGMRKTLLVEVTSTKAVSVRTFSSLGTFTGSTNNSITFGTGSTYASPPRSVDLIGMSTIKWAILSANAPLARATTTLPTVAVQYRMSLTGATA